MNKAILAIIPLLFADSVHASQLTNDLKKCSSVADSLERLVCYDNLVKPLLVESDKSARQDKVVAKKVKAEAAKKPKKPDVAALERGAIAAKEDNFGHETKLVSEAIDEVVFTVKVANLSVRKKWQIEFENGQKWEQKDTDRFFKLEAGDKVSIKRGLMNAFYLKKLDANRTIRIKRVE